jgi:hypothetical protein
MADTASTDKPTGTPVKDANGEFTGTSDPTTGKTEPSPDLAKPADVTPPQPKGGPIVTAKQIKLDKWTLYAEGDNLFAKSPGGKVLQIVMFDPKGITQTIQPNKLSDGSDGSKDSIGGNNVPLTGQPVSVENAQVARPPTDTSTPVIPPGPPIPQIPVIGVNLVLPIFSTLFNNLIFPSIREAVDLFLGRNISNQEYDDLIAATHASTVEAREQAWFAGTVMNRARVSGMNVTAVLNQVAQYPAVRGVDPVNPAPTQRYSVGPSPEEAVQIYQNLTLYLPEVPSNNYWINSISPALLPPGECVISNRNGIQGMLVGQSLVYPGAQWP